MIFDYLKDITGHTFALGNLDVIKVTGTEDETTIDAMAADRSVIIQAKVKNPIPEFIGQFGMPQLGKLNTILGLSEYAEDAKITVTTQERNGVTALNGLNFENKAGDFKNEYRLMSSELVNGQLKTVKFKGAKWDVEFTPAVQNIQRLKSMASANSEETTFIAKIDGGNLKFFFGDHSSHAGDFVFQSGVAGKLSKHHQWPVGIVQGILNLPGDKTFRISEEGIMQLTVDSGLITYNYLIPAQQK